MMDYKSIGDSYITILQKQRGRKPISSGRFAWGFIVISVVYVVIHLIIWGVK